MKLGDVGRCPGHVRHWYAIYGFVGLRSPVCVRCGATNPRPLTSDEWRTLYDLAECGSISEGPVLRALAAERRDRAAT